MNPDDPDQPNETKTGETKTGETKTGGTKTAGTKTGETKTAGTKTAGTKTAGTKTGETKTGGTKTAETKTGETKTGGTKTAGTKTGETKTGGTKTAEPRIDPPVRRTDPIRIAHFSDIHVTLRPHEEPLSILHPKRFLGAVNYYCFGRALHFRSVEDRIRVLLADADAQNVEHVLCTGDVTSMSHEREFTSLAALFGPRLEHPERYTVIPGNHDRYTHAALDERRFERYFGRVSSPDSVYPLVKQLAPGVTMVAIDVARPTIWDSSGVCGEAQLAALENVLTDRALKDQFVILALHYALLRKSGKPDRPSHRLTDYQSLIDLIDRPDVHVDLVVHGHVHKHYEVKTKRRTIVCAGSATDLAIRCGYNVYSIDVENKSFTTERRMWNHAAGAYEGIR